MTPGVGFSLAPDPAYLERCAPVIAAVDYHEVLPEGLVYPADTPEFRENGLYRRVVAIQDRHGKPLVAHGTGLSVCGGHPRDLPRLGRWLDRAATLAERLRFGWYTDHFGITAPAGLNLTLPLPVPFTQRTLRAGRARLDALAEAVGAPCGVENSVFYVPFADPAEEPAFLADLLGDRHVLLLDVHNLWLASENLGVDVGAWLAAAPLDRVIEIHVSGGSLADPAWCPAGALRLDSHDDRVPEPVWALLDQVLPRCPALRGVTLERLEGTVDLQDVDGLLAEVERIRAALTRRVVAPATRRPPPRDWADEEPHEMALAEAWADPRPDEALRRLLALPLGRELRAAVQRAVDHPDGLGITRRLITRQRFERLVQGSARANAWFDEDPAAFAAAFARYVRAVPPTAFLPRDEAALFEG